MPRNLPVVRDTRGQSDDINHIARGCHKHLAVRNRRRVALGQVSRCVSAVPIFGASCWVNRVENGGSRCAPESIAEVIAHRMPFAEPFRLPERADGPGQP
jgi:hypothetical protein